MNKQHLQALYHFADQYGVPRNIAYALIRQESGGNPNARSPVGAEGYTQLMPGTAKGLGVNPRDPIDNLRGGMMYLGHLIKSFGGNIRMALAGYNAGPGAVKRYGGIPPYAETQNYVKRVLAMAGPGQNNHQFTKNRLLAVNAGLHTPTIGAQSPRLAAALEMAAPSQATQSILGRLGGTAERVAAAASAPIPLPASRTGGGQGANLPGTNTMMPLPQAVGRGGKILIAPGADRAGVRSSKTILGMATKISGIYGKPLKVGTGTQHNQYVAGTHNESDHWTGHAVDIPMSGKALTRLGQAALIAAGADPKWARKQTGGVFNIGGYNILFNTKVGGNHFNHLHVGEGH